ncbi:hypothetical protein ACFQ0B_17780 [Nonomuraea thailandensis]
MIQPWLSRHGRRRRLVAAALAAVSVIAAFVATRPTGSAPTVLVAARDLSPGPLDPADFHPAALTLRPRAQYARSRQARPWPPPSARASP